MSLGVGLGNGEFFFEASRLVHAGPERGQDPCVRGSFRIPEVKLTGLHSMWMRRATANDSQTTVSPNQKYRTHEDELRTAAESGLSQILSRGKFYRQEGRQYQGLLGGRCTTWPAPTITTSAFASWARWLTTPPSRSTQLRAYRGPVQTIVTGIRSRERMPKVRENNTLGRERAHTRIQFVHTFVTLIGAETLRNR